MQVPLAREKAQSHTDWPFSTIAGTVLHGSIHHHFTGSSAVKVHGPIRAKLDQVTCQNRINGHEIKDVARYSELTLTGVLQKSRS